jgi:hypothetical protein
MSLSIKSLLVARGLINGMSNGFTTSFTSMTDLVMSVIHARTLATSTLSYCDLIDKDMHPTFFRTIQGDVTLSVAMSKLAKALNFRYVTVLYTDDEYGHGGLKTFTSVSTQENVCIFSSYKIDSSLWIVHV